MACCGWWGPTDDKKIQTPTAEMRSFKGAQLGIRKDEPLTTAVGAEAVSY
jgi:hypothetical protein